MVRGGVVRALTYAELDERPAWWVADLELISGTMTEIQRSEAEAEDVRGGRERASG